MANFIFGRTARFGARATAETPTAHRKQKEAVCGRLVILPAARLEVACVGGNGLGTWWTDRLTGSSRRVERALRSCASSSSPATTSSP